MANYGEMNSEQDGKRDDNNSKVFRNLGAMAMMLSPFPAFGGSETAVVIAMMLFLGGLVAFVAGRMMQ